MNSGALEVVVMGVSGSGKSTVGHALARRLGLVFADADAFHSPANVAKLAHAVALDDTDRAPWLVTIAEWLGAHHDAGAVVACSALRRRYRDVLRTGAPEAVFLHLDGSAEAASVRMTGSESAAMPPSLVDAQIRALEPLGPDERGVVVPFDLPVDDIVEIFVSAITAGNES